MERRVLPPSSMLRRGSTLAWFGTAMLIATAPYVARATLEDAGMVTPPEDGGAHGAELDDAVPEDAGLDDGGTGDAIIPPDDGALPLEPVDDATAPRSDAEVPGPRLPNGEPPPPADLAADSGGCSCSTPRPANFVDALGGGVLLATLLSRRRLTRALR